MKSRSRSLYPALLGAVLAMAIQTAWATNGDQMTALSAPTAAMGGATIAAPRDALTVLYNPAGLADLVGAGENSGIKEVRADFGFGLLHPPRSVNGVSSDSNYYLMPSGGMAFNVNDRLYLGVGMAGVSGMGANVPDISPAPGRQPIVTTKQIFRISPGAAYKVDDRLILGASLNLLYQSLALSNPQYQLPQNQQFGLGATIGAIYKLNDRLQLGGAYTSRGYIHNLEFNTANGTVRFDMDMAPSYAVGVAFKPAPTWLIEADVKRVLFSKVMNTIPVSGLAGVTAFRFGWEDQTVYAIGVRKIVSDKLTLLAGFNYGKSPITPANVNTNLGSMAIVEKHVSVGLTRKLSEHVRGNIAYTHAFGNSITSSVAPFNTISMRQDQLNFNLTYAF